MIKKTEKKNRKKKLDPNSQLCRSNPTIGQDVSRNQSSEKRI
jgi:hypothetical protein